MAQIIDLAHEKTPFQILPLIKMAPLFEADKVYSFFENDCAFAVLGDVATGKVAYENPLWAS